jgi:MYXO-CTERM domain-containing protein
MPLCRNAFVTLALACAALSNAQTSSADGYVYLSASWTGPSDVSIYSVQGDLTWDYVVDPADVSNSDYNLSDGSTYLYSAGSTVTTGPAYVYDGAENVMYWYDYNSGSTPETVDWTFNYESFSESSVSAGYGYDEDFASLWDDETQGTILWDITGSGGPGYSSQFLTDTVTYAQTIDPGQYGLLIGYTLHRSVLSYDATPAPAALAPFGLGLLAAFRRRKS